MLWVGKLKALGITVALRRKADCKSNAPMESVNGTLKTERVRDEHFATREQARRATVDYIGYYDIERRHFLLGYITPVKFERRWRAGLNPVTRGSSQ